MRSRVITTLAGALMAVSVTGAPAVAVTDANQNIPETLTVLPVAEFTVQFWLDPITYGSIEPGAGPVEGTAPGNPASQGRIISSPAGVVVDIDLTASDFTGAGLPTLDQDIRDLSPWTDHPDVWPDSNMTWDPLVDGTQAWYSSSTINSLSPLATTAGVLCDDADPAHWCPFAVSSRVTIPSDATPGDYSGSLEWSITSHY